MSDAVRELKTRAEREGFRRHMGIEVLEIEPGRCLTAMRFAPEHGNVFGMMHGAVVFGLMDEAFQLACNAFGEISVAMQMSLNFLNAPDKGVRLMAEAKQVHATNKTDLYHLRVWQEEDDKPIATCQALAYRTRKPHPWAAE